MLPVLSLKLLAMARLREAGGSPVRHAMAYAGGVIATFLALAVGLLVLRALTGTVGWGFQLQEPLVVLALALLFLLVAANLAGLFEVGLAATRVAPGGGSAFLNGALTTIAATPCGAPFASAAFGFAAVAPAAESLAVFAALGVGLALPAVLVAVIPAAGRLLPRPGAWMEDLRRVLAVPMLGAAGWMLWTYAALAGSESSFLVMVVIIPLVVLAAGAYGRWQGGNRGALGLCLAAVIGAGAVTVWVATAPRPAQSDSASAGWESWTPQREAALRAAGTPMLVDYTAAWCLTCQVNKRTSLTDASVLQAATAKGIVLLRADFTARDPAIAASLARHDRASVPTYVLTDALGRSTVLPDLLTPGIVLDAFANLRSK
jgi:thiol:disulfide interchange protein DsbD